MKLTTTQLRNIIREEVTRVIMEADYAVDATDYSPATPAKAADVNARIRIVKPVPYTAFGKRRYYSAGTVLDGYINDKTGRAWTNKGLGKIQVALPDGSWEEVEEGDPDYARKMPGTGERDGADWVGPGDRY
jgi:hypothetical protein